MCPDAARHRVAQIVVVPSFQQQGIGAALLRAMNKVWRTQQRPVVKRAPSTALKRIRR